jgi:hypothetical protein
VYHSNGLSLVLLRRCLRKLNFYEKALFVKVDVATALWVTQLLLCALRALCFYPHSLLAHTLFCGSVHTMRSVFPGQRRCNLRSGLRGGWTKFTCAVALC